MDDTRATDQMPQTIGRYQIQDSVGFGAMGAVYKAFDPLIKRTLAIKTIRLDIPRQSAQYKNFIERFYHEARISGTLSHPNIVTLFDIGEEGGLPYLAMEFVEGDTIASILDRGTKFKPENVIALVSQIGSAIDYAHGKGVIHRDIKPSNLILYDGDKVKVTDFGIAKLADAEMTQSGTLLGTPSYMSPEQAMGEKLDGRSDIFSLGVCAFEMLSGEQPFPGSNVTAILYKLVHVDPVEPANLELNGLVPQKWHEVFNRVLAKNPDDRYQTATEFVQDLEYCLGAWFGSAMGEQTISENPAAARAASAASAASAPPPGPPRSKQAAAKTLPPVPVGEQDPATVMLKPVARLGESMAPKPPAPAAPAPPPASPPPAPVKPAAASPRPGMDTGTVVLPAMPKPAAPPAKSPAPAVAAAAAAAAAAAQVESTVVLKAPVAVPAKAAPPKPAPTTGDVTMQGSAPTIRTTAAATPRPPRPAAPPVSTRPIPPASAAAATAGRASAAPPAQKGPPMGVILGGIGILLLGILIVAGVIAYRRFGGPAEQVEIKPSAPPPTQARRAPAHVPAATGTLHVESDPPGATVTLDGQERGTTPAELADVPYGAHELKVDLKGYAPTTQSVLLSRQEPRASVSLALSRTPAATGAAEIASDPPGAIVSIGGTPVGQTPFLDPKMKTGAHKVEITKEGYEPWSGTVNVQPGKKARVDARLKSVAFSAPVTTPPAEVADSNRIYVNSPAEVDTPARKTSGQSAGYPQKAARLKSGDSVSVRVTFVVTEEGEVTDVRVVESGGRGVDEAVMAAVKKWKYSPAVKKGTPVKVRVEFRQTFRAG
jgi:TonB family protein